ncbi:MAG: hypothetical protein D6778_08170 [Nitrospirae bacterium]|nr:MAG: hypothetical protein D6778_08170 [Nitrospirota bacterium]
MCILITLVLVYGAIKFVGPYYRYYNLKWDVQDIMKFEYHSPEKYRDLIYERVLEIDVPVTKEEIEVEKRGQFYHAHIEWSEDVEFPGGYWVTLDFTIDE